MSTPRTTLEEKVGAWSRTFAVLREDLTPEVMRKMLASMNTEGPTPTEVQAYVALARVVTANDRAAALSAAMLVSGGYRPVPVEADPDTGD